MHVLLRYKLVYCRHVASQQYPGVAIFQGGGPSPLFWGQSPFPASLFFPPLPCLALHLTAGNWPLSPAIGGLGSTMSFSRKVQVQTLATKAFWHISSQGNLVATILVLTVPVKMSI